ncbi:MAG: hypothetical protein IJL71_07415 [Oscillospiraceae bacterium]|nr:hypothetical protein [Oscillospiraceae bacterium]
MLKKLILLFLCLAMLFGLTCCAGNSGKPAEDAPQETEEPEEPPAEEEPQEEQEEDEPVGDLVVENHTYTYTGKDEFGQDLDLEYHIPRINLDAPGAKAINNEIDKYFFNPDNDYTNISFIFSDKGPKNAEVGYYTINYKWAVNDGILSLVIESLGIWDNSEFQVYNYDVKNDLRLSNSDMITKAGLTETQFEKKAEDLLGSKFWSMFGSAIDNIVTDRETAEFFNRQLSNTISGDNIKSSQLYFNEDGQLCMTAAVYSLAGGDYYMHDLNTEDFTSLPYKLLDLSKHESTTKSADWKTAYTDFINDNRLGMDGSFGFESYGFYLVDINGDAIPELYVDYLTTAGGSELATYADGKVVSQYLTIDSLSFLKGKNLFRESGGRMGSYFDVIYTIENGKFITLAEGSYIVKSNDPYEADYTWAGESVTAEEYEAKLNEKFDTDSAVWAMDTTRYDSQSIIKAIKNY